MLQDGDTEKIEWFLARRGGLRKQCTYPGDAMEDSTLVGNSGFQAPKGYAANAAETKLSAKSCDLLYFYFHHSR